ncbi:MAG: alpha/beta hydrolase [Acidimicrobiales bacterium]
MATGVGGVELALRYWDGGAGSPVLAVHVLASNARLWDQVAERLAAAGHRVVAIDLRGHGRSAKPDSGYDFATVVADLASVVIELGWCRPVVVGQSWGGNLVVELAARYPGVVGGVVCVDGGWIELSRRFPAWEDCAEQLAPPIMEGMAETDLRRRLRSAHPDWSDAGIDGFIANFEVRADGAVAPWLTRERHMKVLRALWEHRPSALYPNVAVPVLLVPALGAGGPGGMGHELVVAAADALASARVAGLVGDHDLHAHRPAELAELVLDWMTESVTM